MVIFRCNTDDIRGRRTEDMDSGNYSDPIDGSAPNGGIFRGGISNRPAYGGSFGSDMGSFGGPAGHVSGMRASRNNLRASSGRVRSSRSGHTTGLDASRRSAGVSGIYDGTSTDTTSHSGLEGYGRYLGVPGATECYDSVFNSMDSSDYPDSPSNDYQGTGGTELSRPVHSFEGGLESYGRYLGSSSEPEDGRVTSNENRTDNFRLNHEPHSRGGLDYLRGVLSGYEGLGSYGQPYIENEDMEFSRGQTSHNVDTFQNSLGYGGRY